MNLTYLELDHQRSAYDLLTSPPHEANEEFLGRLLFSWLYHDHALEGVVLNMETIQRALSQRPTRNYCDAQVKKSLCRVRSVALDLLLGMRKNEEITLDWLREMHRHLSDEDDQTAGRYRKRDTTPGVYNLDCVQSTSISYHLHKFFDLMDEIKDMHPIRRAAIAHWEFMRVFPFNEKTGLVGRLMMNHILTSSGYPPAIIHAHDRHLYFSALDGNSSDLVPVIAEAIRATLQAAEIFYEEFESSGHHAAL